MSANTSLIFPASIDLAGLDRDLMTAEAMIGGFADSASSKLDLKPPAVRVGGGGSGGAAASAAGQLAGSLGGAVGAIRSSLGSVIVPLAAFAAEFRSNFNSVGAIVRELSIRIDSAMRFPATLARVEAFNKGVRRAFGLGFIDAEKSVKSSAEAINRDARFGSFLASIETLNARTAALFRDLASSIKTTFRAIEAQAAASTSGIADSMEILYQSLSKAQKAKVTSARQARDAAGQFGGTHPAAAAAPTAAGSIAPSPAAIGQVKAARTNWQQFKTAVLGTTQVYLRVSKVADDTFMSLVQLVGLGVNAVNVLGKRTLQFVNFLGTVGSVGKATFGKLSGTLLPASVGGMKALGQATGAVKGLASGLGNVLTLGLGPIGLLIGATAGIASFFKGGAKGASDLNETVSKTGVIFGSATSGVTKFADDMAKKFGLVKGTTLDTASAMGGLGKSLGGLRGEKLGAFSTQFTKLAADLSSFSNIDLSSASDAIQSGLAGNQSDTLRALGVDLSEDAVKAKAAALGIAKFGEELNSQQKFAARSALITAGLSKVNGDLERTQGGAANQGRKLMGSIANIGTTIGSFFLPVLTEGIKLLNEFGSWLTKTFEDNMPVIESWKEHFLGAFDYVVAAVHNFPAAFEVAKLVAQEKLANIVEYFAVIGPNLAMITAYVGRNWKELLVDLAANTLTFVENEIHNVGELGKAFASLFSGEAFTPDFRKLTDGFIQTAEKLPALIKPTLTDLSAEIARAATPITDEVATRRAKRFAEKNAVAAVAKDDPAADALGKPKKDKKGGKENVLGEALELGSKEAYSSIVNAASAGSGKDAALKAGRDTAGNTLELVRLQKNADARKKRDTGRLVIA